MNEILTPCDFFEAGDHAFWAKREDLAFYSRSDMPSGAKLRQYTKMIATADADAVLAVGCSAAAAMQVYVAAMHMITGREAYAVVPRRRERTPSTIYAERAGVVIEEVAPGYPNQVRARMRDWLNELGLHAVVWDRRLAAIDTAEQTANLPVGARRVVVPSGSGLTAVGIIGGLSRHERNEITVHIVAMSEQAKVDKIRALAERYFGAACANVAVTYERVKIPYSKAISAALPDGTALDPWYAAKALSHCRDRDVLWITGRRPPVENY